MKAKNKIQANPALFAGKRPGRIGYKPLYHKDGTEYTTIEYFELLGRRANELDAKNKNKALPTNYGKGFDRDVVKVAQEVVKGIDNGFTESELMEYINQCVILNK